MSARKRSSNFSPDEELYLVQLICENKEMIENKCINRAFIAEKEKVWRSIHDKFNSMNKVQRDLGQLKAKYDNLKTSSRKYAQKLQDDLSLGRCEVDRSPVLDLLLDILHKKSICETENQYESDLNEAYPFLSIKLEPNDTVQELDPAITTSIAQENCEVPHESAREIPASPVKVQDCSIPGRHPSLGRFSLAEARKNLFNHRIQKNANNLRMSKMNYRTPHDERRKLELQRLKFTYFQNEIEYHGKRMELVNLQSEKTKLEILKLKKELNL